MGPIGMKPTLSAKGLAIGHGRHVLVSGIDLDLFGGELVALIGVNGGGKSTLLQTLVGLLPPLAGSITLNDRDPRTMSASDRARSIAFVMTGRPQVGLLDVRTLIGLGRQPWTGHFGHLRAADIAHIDEAMALTDTARFSERSLHQLSDGEAQRVMIARALAQDTPCILLDEPMAFLDLVNRVRMLRLLRDLAQRKNKSVLLSTHDLQTALDLCDRILLIDRGVLWSGTALEARSGGILQQVFADEGLRFDADSGSFKAR